MVTDAVTGGGGGGGVMPTDPHAVQQIIESVRVASNPRNRAFAAIRFLFMERMPTQPGSSKA